MNIELKIVDEKSKKLFQNLTEYFAYEYNQFILEDIEGDGRFNFFDIDQYINNEYTKAYIIKVDEKNAGFIMIDKHEEADEVTCVWLVPKYRRGMFIYTIIKELAYYIKPIAYYDVAVFNERWYKAIEYMLKKKLRQYVEVTNQKDFMYITKNGRQYGNTRFYIRIKKLPPKLK